VKKIAILAYGSLIDEPGEELENCIVDRLGPILTPFKVEYARSSRTRGGAPTLVPVDRGGFQVSAVVFVLSDGKSEKEAKDMLWRRETRRAQGSYSPPARPGPNSVLIKTILNFGGIVLVLYPSIQANITSPLTGRKLACLAIASARNPAVGKGKDGISYLLAAKSAGIWTPLTQEYESAILALAGTTTLEAALLSLGR
jgi:hypothetical protein